jgi:hypothetical protein
MPSIESGERERRKGEKSDTIAEAERRAAALAGGFGRRQSSQKRPDEGERRKMGAEPLIQVTPNEYRG